MKYSIQSIFKVSHPYFNLTKSINVDKKYNERIRILNVVTTQRK